MAAVTAVEMAAATSNRRANNSKEVEALRREAARKLAEEMQSAGLWLPPKRLAQFLQSQKKLGRMLEERLVMPALNPADHRHLAQPVGGSFLMRRPRLRIPLIVAFGYEMGLALHSFEYADESDREGVARMCALFNLGVSLFDRVCDRPSDGDRSGYYALAGVFDEQVLRRLLTEDGASTYLEEASANTSDRKLRALLALILAFFSRVRRFASGRRAAAAAWPKLAELLIQAYRAEMVTVSGEGRDGLLEAAQRKSVLPFQIMLAIAHLSGDVGRPSAAQTLACHAGTFFALVDDLSDLAEDYRTGQANTLLLSAGLGEALDEGVRGIADHLRAALKLAEGSSPAMDRARFRDVMLGYAQCWLGADAETA